MNCQEIGELLDNREVRHMDAAEIREVAAHVGACTSCARDWDLHARFAALPTAAPPQGFAARCRAFVAAAPEARSNRWPRRRYAMLGACAAAAAASVIVITYDGAGPGDAAPVPVTTTLVSPPVAQSAPPEHVAPVHAEPSAVKAVATTASAGAAAGSRFSIVVLPLENEASDAAGTAAIEDFYVALQDELRAIEGLTLIIADHADASSGESAQFELQVRGSGTAQDNQYMARLRAMRRGPGGFVQPVQGQFAADCADGADTGTPACVSGSELAASFVDLLRARMFPPDTSQVQSLVAQVQDVNLDARQRLGALRELGTRKVTRVDQGRTELSDNLLRDPAVLRGATDLAARAADPAVRAEIWRRLRGVSDRSLVQPLVAAVQLDPDSEVRLAAVGTLAGDYSGNPDARTALAFSAQQDSRPMVRALANRGLGDEVAWNSYVLTSIKDRSRPDAERVEALLYQLSSEHTDLNEIIDGEAIEALAEVLPRLTRSDAIRPGMNQLLSHLGGMDHPAVTGVLLSSLEASTDIWERQLALSELVSRGSDPRVRAALARVAANDPDADFREMAGRALQQATAAPGSASPKH